jgi:hypothetical protein
MRTSSIILLILAVLAGSCKSAQCQAVVTGDVLDSGGHPLSGASVEAFPIESGGFAGNLNWTKTDDGGSFRLSLRPGRYEIRGKDEPDGYPDPNALLALDSEATFPEVIVDKEEVQAVQVRLGRRGGILEGDLSDEQTAKPVARAKVTLRDAKRPEAFVEVFTDASGHFRFTLPPKPVVISAMAEGYAPAYPVEARTVTLTGGEHRSVTIRLQSMQSGR